MNVTTPSSTVLASTRRTPEVRVAVTGFGIVAARFSHDRTIHDDANPRPVWNGCATSARLLQPGARFLRSAGSDDVLAATFDAATLQLPRTTTVLEIGSRTRAPFCSR